MNKMITGFLMSKGTRVMSNDETELLDIFEREDGLYSLKRMMRKFDEEENCYYWVPVLPDPDGIFPDEFLAMVEAKRLLKLN